VYRTELEISVAENLLCVTDVKKKSSDRSWGSCTHAI